MKPFFTNAYSGNRAEERDVIPRFFQLAQPYRVKLPMHNETFSTAARVVYDHDRRIDTALKYPCGFIAQKGKS